ncbi:hypothetical protein CEUSTIGMA_g4097.t1 [Chlamydomonas eustigma]|uniref:Uncharacterized protein n=1 Tax=Chlamydomonas eustigma TaxID=1157962 RepID=A0A250X0P2_9CHLO|nr:hypothetical protein CEUSTIGMA_g4097.t1 [Chlamydomonas eustigma]|eukprot:GAX76651.1 hypothetical protein CEUSTIGMA_g4097.t1 [Chlamydomonas eustigma]
MPFSSVMMRNRTDALHNALTRMMLERHIDLEGSDADIEKISKAVRPAKGGRTKLQTRTSIHWDDEDATFLCKWFELAAPATVSLNATLTTQPSVSIKEKCKASSSARAEAAGRSAGSNQSDAEKAYTLPITSPIGYNWEVKAKDGMVLTPVTMVWSPERRVYLLNKRDEELAHELALALNAKDSNGRQHRLTMTKRLKTLVGAACHSAWTENSPKADAQRRILPQNLVGRTPLVGDASSSQQHVGSVALLPQLFKLLSAGGGSSGLSVSAGSVIDDAMSALPPRSSVLMGVMGGGS